MKIVILLTSFLVSFLLQAQQRPNILIIISDDHAYQAISAYGSKIINTPNIDRIAREGAIFKKAYVTNSLCGPSRAVILTGKYSHKNGVKDNERSRFDSSQYHFIKQLQQGGYLTSWIGKWHLVSAPQGFDFWKILPGQGDYYNPDFLTMSGKRERTEGYVSNIITDEAESWLDRRDTTKPFCMVVGHKATHRVWLPDTSDFGIFDNTQFPLPANFYDRYDNRLAAEKQDMTIAKTMVLSADLKMLSFNTREEPAISRMNAAQRKKFDAYYKPIEADFRSKNLSGNALTEWKYQRYMKDYLSTANSLDRNIGRLLNYLDRRKLARNTIVIYMSDQGFFLGEHGWFDKRFMYEESFRTPMVIRYPGVIAPGTVINDFVMNTDIAPTCLQIAGMNPPKEIQGQSFLPLFKNKNVKGRQSMYYHYYENGEHAVSPHFGIRRNDYKLIRFYQKVNSWELYDLKKDPHEMNNCYGKKEYAKLSEALKKELLELINRYQDDEARKIFLEK